jgi:hypothetical protein
VIGVVTEAGVWRGQQGSALYRQTWLSGAHAQAAPMRVDVTARFTDAPSVPQARTFLVPQGGRWALSLDEMKPAGWVGTTDAVVEVRCAGACWATVALWHEPIGRGVTPSVYAVPMRCED